MGQCKWFDIHVFEVLRMEGEKKLDKTYRLKMLNESETEETQNHTKVHHNQIDENQQEDKNLKRSRGGGRTFKETFTCRNFFFKYHKLLIRNYTTRRQWNNIF